MGVEHKNSKLEVVLDIRTSVLRLVIDMGRGTVRVCPPESDWGAPVAVCRVKGRCCA